MPNRFFLLAALANFAIALLHFVIPFMGVRGYLYFGSAELAGLAAQGSAIPAIATWSLALVFAIFGLYCLSGSGIIRRLPLLTPALLFIGGIYTLRGLIVFLDVIRLLQGADYPLRQIIFSAAALVIGGIVLFGTLSKWKDLRDK